MAPPNLRVRVFALLCALCLIVSAGYVWMRARQVASEALPLKTPTTTALSTEAAGVAPGKKETGVTMPAGETPGSGSALPKAPFVMFRTTVLDSGYGQLATVLLDGLSRSRVPLGLSCERAYFAGDHGVCLTAERGVITTYHAFIFDNALQSRHRLSLQGIPSRTRVSPDGRYVAITVFVSGHSYTPGSFSTLVEIYRTDDGSRVAELEQFTVERDGKLFRDIDFNFWGVTFAADGNRFYATLGTGGQNYLVEGDLAARHARVIHAGVECPSLSPDGQRVAFKRLTKSGWHLYVVDLRIGAETPLAEMRSVDDQVEWLDDSQILYAFGNDIWVVPADGSGASAIFLTNAYSPAVVRQALHGS